MAETDKKSRAARNGAQSRAKKPPARQNPQAARAPRQNDDWDYSYERSVKFANRGCLLAVGVVIVALIITALVIFGSIMGEVNGKGATATGTVQVQIPAGSGGQTVSGILQKAGLIGSDGIFRFYVRFNGAGSGFQQGTFEVEAGMSYEEIIEVLTTAPLPRDVVTVTFPPGGTVIQFANAAENAGLCTAEQFLDAANNGDYSDIEFFKYVDEQPGTFMRAEGYLAPDTYQFYVDETPYNIVRKLFLKFDSNLKDFDFNGRNAYDIIEEQKAQMPEGSTWGLRQLVTLASVIEEEASIPDQYQASVSGVFWNRLTKPLPSDLPRRTMGSDVTLRYLTDWVARDYGGLDVTGMSQPEMKAAALAIIPQDIFYGYYTGDDDALTQEGLPISPISNPSVTALHAALQPELHNYFYFLAFKNGEYRFAERYWQHQQNIQEMINANAAWEAEQAAGSSGDD